MISNEIFDSIVATLYETVLDADAWSTFLVLLRENFDCSVASLNTVQNGSYASLSTDPLASAEWVKRWTQGNPLSARKMADGAVALAADIVDQTSFVASAYYNEFLLPFDIPQVMILKGPLTNAGGATVNMLRARRQPEFVEADLQVARRISGHVVKAWHAAAQLGWQSWTQLAASLEQARDGMILLDEAGAILHMNRVARALTEARDGIVVSRTSLDTQAPTDRKKLREAIWRATAGPAPRIGTMVAIERSAGAQALIASVTPLADTIIDIGVPKPRALVSVYDAAAALSAPAADLHRLFNLTRRECDVALAIGEGLTVSETAERCGITVVTARNYLARVLRKTQLTRQSELVRLLNGVARLSDNAHRF